MASKRFLSTSEYAKKHRISKMQVIRLIRSGRVVAQRVGHNWMIPTGPGATSQIGMEKSTSLQKWNKIIKNELKKSLEIEESGMFT